MIEKKTYNEYYGCQEIRRNVYRISGADGTNCYLIVGDKEALLIDTAYGYGDLLGTVREKTDLPVTVVCTHGHGDHCLGIYQFPENALYMSKKDWKLAEESSSIASKKHFLEMAEHYTNYVTRESGNIIPEDFPRERYLNDVETNFLDLTEGMKFDLGGILLEAVTLTGHTKGSMGLLEEETGWLFMGDAYGPSPWMFAKEASCLQEFLEDLRKIRKRMPLILWGGHGMEAMDPKILEDLLICGENLDYESGEPFCCSFLPDAESRVCRRQEDPEGVAIVISRDKL